MLAKIYGQAIWFDDPMQSMKDIVSRTDVYKRQVYDSVFTEKSQYFADKKLDLYSENITATLLVPFQIQEKTLVNWL